MKHELGLVAAMLFAGMTLSCNQNCTDMGCGSPVSLTYAVPLVGVDAMRAATFTVCQRDQCFSGHFHVESSGGTSSVGADGLVRVAASPNSGATALEVDVEWYSLPAGAADGDTYRIVVKDYAGVVVLAEQDTVVYRENEPNASGCGPVCRQAAVVGRTSSFPEPTASQPIVDVYAACNHSTLLPPPATADAGAGCSIAGTWAVHAASDAGSDLPPVQATVLFDGTGNWVAATSPVEICLTRFMGGAYRFGDGALTVLTGYESLTGYRLTDHCPADGVRYEVTFDSTCTQARLQGSSCAGPDFPLASGTVLTKEGG